jgi:hypothetical protein
VKHVYFVDFDMKAIVGGGYVPSYVPEQHDPDSFNSDPFDRAELDTYFDAYTGDASLFEKF